ncbi:MAG: hypothetical protein JNM99_09150 [Verrucomicrobiaceae bacterium]|nr:hypothetical protein [Verrucomicrobiaceae bacterium]
MSDPLRIALVAEGPTDAVVIEAALRSMLGVRPFVLKRLFPEDSAAFGPMGTGWVGVYKWCHAKARDGGGKLSGNQMIFGAGNYDLLLLHLDGDVAGYDYADGSLVPLPTDGALPCAKACPPPADTTNELRKVLLSWCGEAATPPKTVVCMPSKNTEAWVVASLFPNDQAMTQGIECYGNPESRLGQQPAAARVRKKKRDYLSRAAELEQAWPRIALPTALGEAFRFQTEFLTALPAPQPNTLQP